MKYLLASLLLILFQSNPSLTSTIDSIKSEMYLCTITEDKSQFSKVGEKRLSYIFVINTNRFNCDKNTLLDYAGFEEEWEIDFIGKNKVWKMNYRKEIPTTKAFEKACKIVDKEILILSKKKSSHSFDAYYKKGSE